jgi:hypothetical protein
MIIVFTRPVSGGLVPDATPVLLVSDHVAGSVHLLTVPDGAVTGRLTGRHLSEHAGFLALPGGRVACVDDRRGELLVLDPFAGKLVERAIPVAVPAAGHPALPRRLLASSQQSDGRGGSVPGGGEEAAGMPGFASLLPDGGEGGSPNVGQSAETAPGFRSRGASGPPRVS